MRTEEVHNLVDRAATLESCARDRVSVEMVVGELARLRAWEDSRDVAAAKLVSEVSSFPEKSLADAGRTGLREAGQTMRRAETVDEVTELVLWLDAGRWWGAHVDGLRRAWGGLEPDQRGGLIGQ